MDLKNTDAEIQFRKDLREWLSATLPTLPEAPDANDWPGRREYGQLWQQTLHAAGYAGIDWPTEAGGRGATPTEHLIYLEETEAAGAPYIGTNFVGLLHAGPTINACGTDEQRARYLPKILDGSEVWCQGFSEPDAGSDLASLQTKAVLDGDHYVVNGSKIWTSHAQVADWCELLVRTDPDARKHRGITWLTLDMKTPGVEVRPMRTIVGSEEFSEVFLDDVRIPVANRVGEENDGWRVAMVTFSFERGTAFVSELLECRLLLEQLANVAKTTRVHGEIVWDDTDVRRKFGQLNADFTALWALTRRNISQAAASGVPGYGGSVFKLVYPETRKKMGELALDVLGPAALSLDDFAGQQGGKHVRSLFHGISIAIAAGTTQIQRNILGERVLGLPKDGARA